MQKNIQNTQKELIKKLQWAQKEKSFDQRYDNPRPPAWTNTWAEELTLDKEKKNIFIT